MKKTFLILSLLLFLAGGSLAKDLSLTLLYTNDTHGHLLPFDMKDSKDIGGISRRAALIDKIRKEAGPEKVLVLDAGDVYQGTPMSAMFKGKVDYKIMKMIGYDAMTLGNHEFDFGQKVLLSNIKDSGLPVVCSNVIYEKTKQYLIKPMAIKVIGGIRIGIIGIVTPETPTATHPDNVKGLRFTEPVSAIKYFLSKTNENPAFLIVLSHCGYDSDIEIAKAVPQVNVIVGGHTHTKVEKPTWVGNAIVVQDYQWGADLGRLDLKITGDEDNGYTIKDAGGKLIPITDKMPSVPAIDAVLDHYSKLLSGKMDQVIGFSGSYLDNSGSKKGETSIGDLVSDVIRQAGKAQIGFQNGGGIRSSLDKGPVTIGEMYTILPFDNTITVMQLTGSQIKGILERSLSSAEKFMQVSGAVISIKAGKITEITVGGEKLEAGKLYRVATNDFLTAGGDGFDTFKSGKTIVNTGINLRDAAIRHIRALKNIPGTFKSRFVSE